MASFIYQHLKTYVHFKEQSVYFVQWEGESWILDYKNCSLEGELLEAVFLSSLVIVMRFRTEVGVLPVIIFSDACCPQAFRRLSVYLGNARDLLKRNIY